MKLPDFEQFEPFNQLRRQMGADELGSFEPFDPALQLTSLEAESLAQGYLEISHHHIRSLPDHTLAYKNARIVLFELKPAQEHEVGLMLYEYHLANCRHLNGSARSSSGDGRVLVSLGMTDSIKNKIKEWSTHTPIETRPCWECLHALRVDGFDGDKHRKRLHSEQVWRNFELSDFTQKFIMYPLPEELWG